MGQAEQNAAIVAIIKTATGLTQVYGRERYKTAWQDFLDLYKTSGGKVNGYMVSRRQKARVQTTIGQVEEANVFLIRGFLGFQDADNSEGAFQAQVDLIDAALLADETLTDSCETTHPDWGPMANSVGLQVDVIEPRKFGTVLCHFFEGRICAVTSRDV